MAVRIIGEINRYLLDPISAVYFGDNVVALLDAQGNSLIGELPDPPAVTGTIADRVYTVGQSVPATDLRTKFSDATSYLISPAIAAAVIDGHNLTFPNDATRAQTSLSVRGVNAGGQSDPVTFALTVNAVTPTLIEPLPDQSLILGGATLTIPLDDHFSGVATYVVSPTGQGATISVRNLVLNLATARDTAITVTATNSTGQSVSDTFAFVVAAQPVLTVTLSPNPPVAGTLLTITFSAAPDSVSATLDGEAVALTGSGTTRTLTPAAEGDLVITAAKSGYTSEPVTVEVAPAVDPGEAPGIAATPDAVIEITSITGTSTTFAVLLPSVYAGSYTVQHADLAAGPVWLVRPALSITTEALPRGIVTRIPGIYVYDTDLGPVTETQGMANNTTPIPDTTADTYVIAEADRGDALTSWATATQPGGKARTAISDVLQVLATGLLPDTFTAPDGTLLTAYSGESGQTWDKMGSANAGPTIREGYLHGTNDVRFLKRSDDVATGKYTVTAKMRSVLNTSITGHHDRGITPAVGIKGVNTGFFFNNAIGTGLRIMKRVAGADTLVKSRTSSVPVNTDYEIKLAVDGTTCTVSLDGVVVPALGFTDADLAGGAPGVYGWGAPGTDNNKIDSFKVETA